LAATGVTRLLDGPVTQRNTDGETAVATTLWLTSSRLALTTLLPPHRGIDDNEHFDEQVRRDGENANGGTHPQVGRHGENKAERDDEHRCNQTSDDVLRGDLRF
jgi:hypothetical protein